MRLKLQRRMQIILDFEPPDWQQWIWEIGGVEVRPLDSSKHEEGIIILVEATIPLDRSPALTADNRIVLPDEEMNAAQTAIEATANLMAVGTRGSRRLSSPTPPVEFIAEDKEASAWLDGTDGIYYNMDALFDFRAPIEWSTLHILAQDRLDGVLLVSEALSQSHASGCFRDCIRLFELAFGRATKPLIDPLSDFLQGTAQNFTHDEVLYWIDTLRHQATHADLQIQTRFVVATQLRSFIPRVMQATYDVLFNKAIWKDPSTRRRNVWSPDAFIASRDGRHLVIKQHSTPEMKAQFFADL